MVIGWLRPVVLLPVSVLAGLTPEQVRAHYPPEQLLAGLSKAEIAVLLAKHAPKKPAPRHINLVLARDIKVPAYCSNATITVSVEWLQKHPDDLGVLTHELTHAVQAYPNSDPGWLTEGLADYARHLYGPKEQPGWALPAQLTAKQSYKDSYRVTGRFLLWLDDKHPGVVDKLHRRMQDREFAIEDFRTFTGTAIDELWEDSVRELKKKP